MNDITAVKVVVQRTSARLLSGLFLTSDPVISVASTASVLARGPACLLALSGGLTMTGNTNVVATNCLLASNSTSATSVSITGSASVTAQSISSVGGCSGCGSAALTLPYTEYAPPTTNPFTALDSKVLPTFSNSTCYTVTGLNNSNGVISVSPLTLSPQAGKAICALRSTGNQVIHFTPGIYYFYNSSFIIDGGTIDCPTCTGGKGVTLVFTGLPASIGGLSINAAANVTLTAPTAPNSSDPAYAGILFFRNPLATGGNTQGNPAVNINGGANTVLTGGMYFPSSYVKYSGNSNNSTCSVLVGGTVQATGNSGLNVSQCSQFGFGNLVPITRIVRLVE